jgi:hypothetical protein
VLPVAAGQLQQSVDAFQDRSGLILDIAAAVLGDLPPDVDGFVMDRHL